MATVVSVWGTGLLSWKHLSAPPVGAKGFLDGGRIRVVVCAAGRIGSGTVTVWAQAFVNRHYPSRRPSRSMGWQGARQPPTNGSPTWRLGISRPGNPPLQQAAHPSHGRASPLGELRISHGDSRQHATVSKFHKRNPHTSFLIENFF